MTYLFNHIQLSADSKLSELPFAEQFLLWGIRMWAQAFNQGVNNYKVLNKGFCLAGVSDAHKSLDYIMTIFATSGKGIININCPKCNSITFDELRFMGAVAAWQSENELSIGNIYIRSWLPLTALRIMRRPSLQLAKTLKQGNLIIHLRPWVRDLPFINETNALNQNQNWSVH